MAADLQPVIDEMTEAETVMDSAIVFITSVPSLISTAVSDALANGATADQLKPVSDLGAGLKVKTDALKAALTPPTP